MFKSFVMAFMLTIAAGIWIEAYSAEATLPIKGRLILGANFAERLELDCIRAHALMRGHMDGDILACERLFRAYSEGDIAVGYTPSEKILTIFDESFSYDGQ